MNIFKRIKIWQKIVGSFIVISLFVGLVGIIGIRNMKNINDNAISMYSNNLMQVNETESIKGNIALIFSDLLKMKDEKNISVITQL